MFSQSTFVIRFTQNVWSLNTFYNESYYIFVLLKPFRNSQIFYYFKHPVFMIWFKKFKKNFINKKNDQKITTKDSSSLFNHPRRPWKCHPKTHQTPPMQTRHIKSKSNSFYVTEAFSSLEIYVCWSMNLWEFMAHKYTLLLIRIYFLLFFFHNPKKTEKTFSIVLLKLAERFT